MSEFPTPSQVRQAASSDVEIRSIRMRLIKTNELGRVFSTYTNQSPVTGDNSGSSSDGGNDIES